MPFTAPADELLAPSKSFRAPDDEVVKPAFVAPPDEVVNLSKIQATPVNQPSQFSSGLPASVPIADNPDWAFTKATRGGLPGLTQDAMAAGMGAVGDVTAFAMNNLNRPLQWAGVPIPKVESGKPIIPDEALPLAKEKGVIPALTRILQGFTTPENIALLPLAVESKAVQGAFLAQSGMALPDAANKVLSAKTPEEQRDAGTELVANLAMAALMAKGMSGKAAPEAPRVAAPEPPAAPAAESGFTAPADEVVAPAQPPAPFNPVAEAQNQLRSESKGTAAPGGETINTPVIGEQTPPAPTADNAGSVVQKDNGVGRETPVIATGEVETPGSRPATAAPTIAEKAAAAPSQPVTLADLAQLQAEMRGNQLKPSEPAKPSPPVPAEAAAPAALPGQSDFDRYQELTSSLKGKSMDEAQPILSEIEAIKNRNGGMAPTETVSPAAKSETQPAKPVISETQISQPSVEATKNTPVAEPKATQQSGQSAPESVPETGKPFEFYSVRNKNKSPNMGARFGQDVEPHGKYMTQSNPDSARNLPANFEHGAAKFENPLVVDFGAGYGDPTNWKNVVSKQFGGKKGKALSQAIRDAGYDGIVTVEPSRGPNRPAHTSEIVDLKDFKASGKTVKPVKGGIAEESRTDSGLKKVSIRSVDTPVQGVLNQAKKLKADAWKRVQELRQKIKDTPLGAGNLRLDLMKAEGTHREAVRMEEGAKEAIEKVANEQGKTTIKAKAEAIADKLESLKTGIGKGGQLHAFGAPALIWDKAIEVAQAVIRAGGNVADAIESAIRHIKSNHKGEFDEQKAREALSEKTAEKPLPEGSSPANKFSAIVRDALDLPERETPERQSRESVIADAEQRMAKSPALAADLVDKITQSPRELQPWEQVVFLRHVVDLKKSLEAAREEVFQAKKDGNLADEEIAVLHAQELSDKVFAAVDAFEKSGTPSARSLQFRNTLMKEDYSTESLEMGARAARGGERLSESELAKIKEQSDEIHATQQKIDEETKAQAERDAEEASIHAHAEMVKQAEREPWHAFSPAVYERAQKIVASLEAAEKAALERLRKKGYRLNVGLDPTDLSDFAIVGASRMAKFAVKSAEWADSMVETFGEAIREHLPRIAAAAEKVFNKADGDKIPKPRTKAGKPVDTIETLKATIKKIHDEIGEGATPKDYANLIRAIAKRAVEGGMRDRNALVDSVHNVLKERGVEIKRNEVRDAISGYGDYRQLSKLEADVELRRMKAELQKVAQIEALEKGQPPLKSGMEHGKLSDEARRMVQRINQLKKELGITSGDPETQLKSALASKKTRLNNQIRDLEHEIATREKIVREHGQAPTDPEADALTAKRDSLKKERDSIFKGDMSDEQRLALSERAAQRSLDEWNQKLADAHKGKFDLGETKRDMPASDKLKAVRDARDAAKAEVDHLKALAHPELADQSALAAQKARLLRSIATYSDKLARGDFSTRPKPKINPKLAVLEAQKKRVFETYRAANKKATLARRPFWVKAVEAVPKFIGQAVLSSPATLVKLAAASATHVALRPIDDMVGGALGRVPGLRGIAGEARTEGAGFSPSNYAKALAKAATQGVIDARKTLNLKATFKPVSSYAKGVLTMDKAKREAAKTEFRNVSHTSDLDERFGKAGHGRDSLEFFGLLHGAEKAPLKRFVFEYNYARGVDWAERNGLDPKDPIVAMRIGLDAYKQAQRALFLEDNRATDAFSAGLNTLARTYKTEVAGKTVEKHPALGTIGTAAIRANMPVIKVAANVMAQAFERSGGGLVMGTGRILRYGGSEAAKRGTGMTLAERFQKGLSEMPEGESDKVIGNLKRGLVGSAFMLFAFYNYQNFGGFWQQGEKRKEGEIKADEIRLGDHDVPPLLLHNPLFIAGQAAATARKVAESKLRKKDTEAQGYDDGLLAAALGIAQTTPFTREAENISQILNPHTRQSALGRAAQMAVPQLIQAPARWMDKDAKGEVIKRAPTNIWQSLEMGIPGLRPNVPEKKK